MPIIKEAPEVVSRSVAVNPQEKNEMVMDLFLNRDLELPMIMKH